MSQAVKYEIEASIGVISVDNPPVNALSLPVRQGLMDAITAAQDDASEAVVIVCEGRTFIAGADITEFGKPPVEPYLPDLLNAIEASKKPVIAALHGTALGGGLETALSAHRIFGLPAWAMCGSFPGDIPLPQSVHRVVVVADHDQSGISERRGRALAESIRETGCQCQVIMPDHAGADANDVLRGAA